MSSNSGLLLALGAVTGLAAGAVLSRHLRSDEIQDRGLTHDHGSRSCHSCGSRSGSRSCEEKDEARGSYLMRQRVGARAGFVVPLSRIEKYCGPENSIGQAFLKKNQQFLQKLLAVNDERALLAHDIFQRTLLIAAGVMPEADSKVGTNLAKNAGPDHLMSLHTYASDKVHDWAKRQARQQKVVSEQARVEMYAEYAAALYAKRAWCLHILEGEVDHHPGKPVSVSLVDPATGKKRTVRLLSVAQRQAVYDDIGKFLLLSNVDFTLCVPTRMPSSDLQAAPGHQPALYTQGSGRTSQKRLDVAGAVTDDAAQESEVLDEEGELEDAALLRGMLGAPVLTMTQEGVPVGVFFLAQVSGSLVFPYGLKTISLITTTSKMASPSFGLPAGSSAMGGTCPSGDIGLRVETDKKLKSGKIVPGAVRRQEGTLQPYVIEAIQRRRGLIAANPRDKSVGIWLRDIGDLEAGIRVPVADASRTKDKLVPAYTCAVCYAMSANYGYANNLLAQAARKKWVEDLLAVEDDGVTAGANFAQMIWTYASSTIHGERACQEIGVWSRRGIVTPSQGNPLVAPTPLRIETLHTPFSPRSELPSGTADLFQDLAERGVVEDGDVAGFFRLHDSGDFGLGIAYTRAWLHVARAFPGVYFWAPTRQWGTLVATKGNPKAADWAALMAKHSGSRGARSFVLRAWRRPSPAGICWKNAPEGVIAGTQPALQAPGETGADSLVSHMGRVFAPSKSLVMSVLRELAALPNVSIRPSSLYIRRSLQAPISVPYVEGLSAGSGVAAKVGVGEDRAYPPMNDTRGVAAYQCPVYTKMAVEGGGEKEAKSCRTANCRACWIAKDLPIFYGAH